MTKWEYKIISKALTLNDSELNKFGSEGWELCGVSDYQCVFKRSIPKSVKPMVQERLEQTDMGFRYGQQTDR